MQTPLDPAEPDTPFAHHARLVQIAAALEVGRDADAISLAEAYPDIAGLALILAYANVSEDRCIALPSGREERWGTEDVLRLRRVVADWVWVQARASALAWVARELAGG